MQMQKKRAPTDPTKRYAGSNFPGALGGDRIAPAPFRPRAHSFAFDVNVEQVMPAFDGRHIGAPERVFDRSRFLDCFTFDAERARGLGELHVRIALVAGHVARGFELPSGRIPDAVTLIIVP